MLRARRIATQLIHVIAQLGWRFNPKAPAPKEAAYNRRSYETPEEEARRAAHFLIEDERLFISITERQTRTERSLTPEEQTERRRNPNLFYYRNRYSYHASGELTLHVSSSTGSGGFATIRDSKRSPLETRISDIIRSLLQGALNIKQRRKEAAEAAERQRQEELRRERIRKSREAHGRLIARLEAEAGAWERAQRLRRYLRAARRTLAPGERIEARLEDGSVDLLALGEDFANQLDPLHASLRRVPFFDAKDPYATCLTYESDEIKLQRFVARVLGGDWRAAPKWVASGSNSE
jgi:hypothetical protein